MDFPKHVNRQKRAAMKGCDEHTKGLGQEVFSHPSKQILFMEYYRLPIVRDQHNISLTITGNWSRDLRCRCQLDQKWSQTFKLPDLGGLGPMPSFSIIHTGWIVDRPIDVLMNVLSALTTSPSLVYPAVTPPSARPHLPLFVVDNTLPLSRCARSHHDDGAPTSS